MTQKVQQSPITVLAGAAVNQYRLGVKSAVGADGLMTAIQGGAGEQPHGVFLADGASGDYVAFELWEQGKTMPCRSGAAITRGNTVYPAATGKVSETAVGAAIGIALTTASGDDEPVEVLPLQATFLTQSDITTWHVFEEDFLGGWVPGTSGTITTWLNIIENSSTAAPRDEAGGVLRITTGTTANDQHIVNTVAENWLFAASKPLVFEARVKLTEGTANSGAFFVGLTDTVSADQLVDTTGAIRASWIGTGFYKAASANLRVTSSNGATQNTGSALTTGDTTIAMGAVYWKLKITVEHTSSTTCTIKFYGLKEGTHSAFTLLDTHTLLYASAAEMHLAVILKNTAGTTADIIDVDYLRVSQTR